MIPLHWDWFYYLYSIAFIFIIVGFLWKVVFAALSLVTLALNESMRLWVLRISMFIPYYFLAIFTFFVSIAVNDGEKSILLITLGGIFFLIHGVMGIGQTQRDMDKNGEYDFEGFIKYRYVGLLLGIGLYAYLLFDQSPAFNDVTVKVAIAIDWIRDIPVLNWFIAGFSFFYVIYTLLIFVVIFFGSIVAILSSIRNRNQAPM